MKAYLKGTVLEMLERARTLKGKPLGSNQDVHFNQLSINTLKEIDNIIHGLECLLDIESSISTKSPSLKGQLFTLKGLIRQLDFIENYPIAVLSREVEDDIFINSLIHKICKEINYPLTPPVTSCLSQNYYFIIPQYNLMCVPLLEADFLLHIPDVYHELAHSIIDSYNHPKVELYRKQLGGFQSFAVSDFESRIIQEKRKTTPLPFAMEILYNLQDCWARSWAIEFYCDLFGVFCIGPAFAWSHMHLCLKRGSDPFAVPKLQLTDHPPDNARMDAILIALDLLGFTFEKDAIETKWKEYLNLSGYKAEPEYFKAIPKNILEHCVNTAITATKSINILNASHRNANPIYSLLNNAWNHFLTNPESYLPWEKQELLKLRSTYSCDKY